jgi:signal transduction histidine kinase
MFPRRSLSWPITLGIVMIVLLVVLTVGWVLLALFGAMAGNRFAPLYWTLLTVGTTLLVLVLVGVVMYLSLSVKAISLNQRQSNFIDSVTHELKSPIASLKLYLQTLGRYDVSDAERENFYRYMLEDVERLDQLINHLLDAARLEREPAGSELKDVDLAALLRQSAAAVCLQYQVSEEVVLLDLMPCVVRASPVDLDLIFRNLIDNAVKYSSAPPQVIVSLRMESDHCTVTRICDNGPGIPQNLRRKIFGRFVRLGKELERDKPGTGLGLYIVRTLVKRLRGRIRVLDSDDGRRTIFEVQLPGSRLVEQATRDGRDVPQEIQKSGAV